MHLILHAGQHPRRNAVCAVKCPNLPVFPEGRAKLVPPSGPAMPAVIRGEGESTELIFILDWLGAGESIVCSLEPADPSEAPVLCAELTERGVCITKNSDFLTEYYTGTDLAKPYLGPLCDRYGAQVTRLDFAAKEHPHHRSLWISHGSVNGVDTWNEPAGTHGFIRNRGLHGCVSSRLMAAFTADNVWTDHGGKPLLDESTAYRIYAPEPAKTVIDLEIRLTAAYGPVTLGATKEAGPLAVRMADSLRVSETGTMKNGVGGINEDEIWMHRAPWVDYAGLSDGRACGVAVLDNPANEGFPSYWHARNYGLLAVNNFYRGGEKQLAPGETASFAYRVVIHSGDTEAADIQAAYNDYAHGVTVEPAPAE